MDSRSDLKNGTTPAVSKAIQHYIFAFVQDAINQPCNSEKGKKWLTDFCKKEGLSYTDLEYNLTLFFQLLNDYRKTSTFHLYGFLKLQAKACFIDEDRFFLLRIGPSFADFQTEYPLLADCLSKSSIPTSGNSGIVGAHIIGL